MTCQALETCAGERLGVSAETAHSGSRPSSHRGQRSAPSRCGDGAGGPRTWRRRFRAPASAGRSRRAAARKRWGSSGRSFSLRNLADLFTGRPQAPRAKPWRRPELRRPWRPGCCIRAVGRRV